MTDQEVIEFLKADLVMSEEVLVIDPSSKYADKCIKALTRAIEVMEKQNNDN